VIPASFVLGSRLNFSLTAMVEAMYSSETTCNVQNLQSVTSYKIEPFISLHYVFMYRTFHLLEGFLFVEAAFQTGLTKVTITFPRIIVMNE
jgi:hypothetical protein